MALTIVIIGTVFYLRRHFNLTQFYPNHVKLFSKEQLGAEQKFPTNEKKSTGKSAKTNKITLLNK